MKKVKPTEFPKDPLVLSSKDIGLAIRSSRTQYSMEIETAARKLGISKQTLCNIEHGKGSVAVETVLRVAHEFGISIFAVPTRLRSKVKSRILSIENKSESTNTK